MSPRFTYAGRLNRVLANLIDGGILLLPGLVLTAIFGESKGPLAVAAFATNLAYVVFFLSSPWHATPGKRVMNMYVVHADGSPLTARDALERFLAYILPSLPLYMSLLSENVAVIVALWLNLL